MGTKCTAIHFNESGLRRAPDEGSLFVRGRQLAPVPGGGRLRFQGFKPAVVPAFLDVMSGGNIGKTIVDIAG